jgi:hypothetical protein
MILAEAPDAERRAATTTEVSKTILTEDDITDDIIGI